MKKVFYNLIDNSTKKLNTINKYYIKTIYFCCLFDSNNYKMITMSKKALQY